jgi:large subunit ribosomal protein L6
MSRIGKLPIPLLAKVKVDVKDGTVHVEGPKGKLQFDLPKHISARIEDGKIVVSRDGETAEARALHGLTRSIVNNMVQGVGVGYTKRLEIHGVGFKASVQGQEVTMNLGYSHPINYQVPAGVSVKVEDNTKLVVEGADKQAVGQVASEFRS